MGSILNDEPSEVKSALRPLGNGKLVALGQWFVGLVLTILAAYFSVQKTTDGRITAAESRIAVVEAKADASKTLQETQFKEVLRTLDRIEAELVRLRSAK